MIYYFKDILSLSLRMGTRESVYETKLVIEELFETLTGQKNDETCSDPTHPAVEQSIRN